MTDYRLLWNSEAASPWVELDHLVGAMFQPFEEMLVGAAAAGRPRSVLDVGCGTGGLAVAIARETGASCVGVDVSSAMVAAARERARRAGVDVEFVEADAQVHQFDADGFDLVVSRFGVMFFADPVAAFANLRKGARANTGMRLVVWRSLTENPFMTTADHAAAPLLPDLPAKRDGEPGQFGMADADHVRAVLGGSGWTDVELHPVDVVCTLPLADLPRYVGRFGTVGRALQTADDVLRARLLDTVLPAFDPFVDGDEVRFTAACWSVAAQAGE
ncbi:class I SAM-dependent methyltransferase [Actinokineospora pegani]|uniref:class I SAM-dependent methyltransferase n=1 Tax=Actinokineospora pegani TaxID=2654637 RepID=UPI0012EA5A0F|nr:class I SAM-dependent methyltransferase [Actinokineospora pegani]